ncbi:integral membrane protein TerC [Pseudomonas saudimassiliensis]|uniref:Integral membrane protein TerC n=1 Tax=Pseudomonas saudimassiliensis TaxID=1461581 RepID=A0A078MIV5_9PSED|nr:TerC family protein [Pseudomonas saudimassiliensis]CEA06185.1 integral membrane protein TerC [Pseudomonas saudimassiliensis]CEF27610.1 integral membrane protein TerC [Pseudomonas saudimassiliensis]
MFEWMADPTVWAGLFALIALEIVLGIDNLVFIAVLAEKLPPHQRDRARVLGLSLALIMRLMLLMSIAWLVTLTNPLFQVGDHPVSARDLIMLAGGLFLLFKATMELHERLEGRQHTSSARLAYSSFGVVVTQIVILDAVFSIDSVITAIGMADELAVMAIAMIVAMAVMLLASKRLTRFVNAHPTLIILCLGFLLMIGFSLVAEGVGLHIPKGYLYAAIGFSIMVEFFNQLARHNKQKWLDTGGTLRERTANNILRLLGKADSAEAVSAEHLIDEAAPEQVFQENERDMIRGVLSLADTNIKALMTPRREVHALDLASTLAEQRQQLLDSPYSRLAVIRDGKHDEPLGIVQKKTLLDAILRGGELDFEAYIEQPVVLFETQNAIKALEAFRHEGKQMAFVVDEFGTLEGIVSLTDIMEAIAGELPEAEQGMDLPPSVVALEPGRYEVDASENLEEINRQLPEPLPRSPLYTTLAGLILNHLEHMPEKDELLTVDGWQMRILEIEHMRIARVELTRQDLAEARSRD